MKGLEELARKSSFHPNDSEPQARVVERDS